MQSKQFLSPAEVSARWEARVTVRTLANWRSLSLGPRYIKLGGRVSYRLADLVEWESRRTVQGTGDYSADPGTVRSCPR